ncbi:hypothetical protein C8R47DRAFT_1207301 [Mycena vitilis]|nr:hypothetical protein C8R47DRAFT_1207301 [Mycena vitilis]
MAGLSRLRIFEFSTDDWSNDTNVITGLKSLRTLNNWDIKAGDECRFPAWNDEMIWSPTAFRALQFRLCFELETLELQGFYLEENTITTFLENLPSLKSLSIGDFLADEEFIISIIQALTWSDSRSFLPRLERLKLGVFQYDVGDGLFIAMVKSRLDPERVALGYAQLRSVWLETESLTQSIDRWWWEWKLGRVFPTLAWRYTVLS